MAQSRFQAEMQAEVAARAQRQAAERAPRLVATDESRAKVRSSAENTTDAMSRRELRARARRAREDERDAESARSTRQDESQLASSPSRDARLDERSRDVGDRRSDDVARTSESAESERDFERSDETSFAGMSAQTSASERQDSERQDQALPSDSGDAQNTQESGVAGELVANVADEGLGGQSLRGLSSDAASMLADASAQADLAQLSLTHASLSGASSSESTTTTANVDGVAAGAALEALLDSKNGTLSSAMHGAASPAVATDGRAASTGETAWNAVDQELAQSSADTAAIGLNERAALSRSGNAADGATISAAQSADASSNVVQRTLLDIERAFAKSVQQTQGLSVGTENATLRAQDAVAGRLSEVEGSIARARVVDAMESQEVQISMDSRGNAADSQRDAVDQQRAVGTTIASQATLSTSASAAMSQREMSSANTALAGSTISTEGRGALGHAGLASDLAKSDGEIPAAARLAAKGAHVLANQRGGTITMRLEPPALGQLRIELRVAHGAVHADFTAATPEARVLIESNLGMLRERLESQGLSVDRMTVHGGNRPETTVTQAAQSGTDGRTDADARDRSGERTSNTQQDAADGESRGRRDGDGTRDGSRNTSSHASREDRGASPSQRSNERSFAQFFGASLGHRTEQQGSKQHANSAEPSRRAS